METVVEGMEHFIITLKITGKDDNYIINNYEQTILKINNPELSYWFVKNIKEANIMAHEQVVIDSRSLRWNYYFAKDIKGANVKTHGQVIIESRNPYSNLEFAINVKGSDVISHGQIIIDTKNPELNYEFAFNVKGSDIRAHRQVIMDRNDIEWICKFNEALLNSYNENGYLLYPLDLLIDETQYKQNEMAMKKSNRDNLYFKGNWWWNV